MIHKIKTNIHYPDGDPIDLFYNVDLIHDRGETFKWIKTTSNNDETYDELIIIVCNLFNVHYERGIIFSEIGDDVEATMDNVLQTITYILSQINTIRKIENLEYKIRNGIPIKVKIGLPSECPDISDIDISVSNDKSFDQLKTMIGYTDDKIQIVSGSE